MAWGRQGGYYGRRAPARWSSHTTRAGLTFSVSRTRNLMKSKAKTLFVGGGHATRIYHRTGGVFMAAILEYIAAELLELSGDVAKKNKKKFISPRHIQLAVRNDEELARLFKDVLIPSTGVVPHIHKELLPPPSRKVVAAAAAAAAVKAKADEAAAAAAKASVTAAAYAAAAAAAAAEDLAAAAAAGA